jgi:5'-3' exoribonuclease 2
MGVPYFFRYITTNYNNCVLECLNNRRITLYFDFNGIIYDAKASLTHTNISKKIVIEYHLIEKVIEILNNKINSIGFEKIDTIYIAIDGVAPMAKMVQQRQRRYKSVKETELLQNLNKEYNKTTDKIIWDTNAITPGTKFMHRLNCALEFYAVRLKEIFPNIELIIDNSNNAGEGEHKLLEHMNNNKDLHKEKNKVIYGLDADLIILTMLKGYPNTYLFRESCYYPFKVDEKIEYLFMDVIELRKEIMIDFGISEYEHSDNAFQDYIFLTFLLGNDFIPNLFILKIQKDGFEYMRDIYKNGLKQFKRFLLSDKGIDLEFLSFIIYGLYKNENKLLYDQSVDIARWKPYLNPKLTEYERKKALIGYYPYYIKEKDTIQLGNKGWVERFNTYWLGDNEPEILNNVVINYLEGLEWILAYYSNGCKNWFWHYRFPVAPNLYSLYQSIEQMRKNTKYMNNIVETKYFNNLKALNLYQLIVVIPKKSLKVIPKEYRDLYIKPEFAYLMPSDFKLLTLFKRFFHECYAVLPRVETQLYDRVNSYINNHI